MHASYNPSEAPAGQRSQRILIIDDNTAIHEDVRKILGAPAHEDSSLDSEAADIFGVEAESLTHVEFEIDSAFQGQEGLAKVQHALDEGRPYAMAFVDVRMPPGWDGIETISRIWKMYPELQVVICTAYSDYSWEEMIRKIGKTDNLVILKKPFDNIEVLQLAHTLILVVEDEPAVRKIMTNVLRHHGYSVFEAADGPEAIAMWSQKSDEVDLLVTDIVMPNGLNGNVLAGQLKADKASLKVLFSTGYSSEFGTEAAPLDEQFGFLEKPYTPTVLVRAVRDCLDR